MSNLLESLEIKDTLAHDVVFAVARRHVLACTADDTSHAFVELRTLHDGVWLAKKVVINNVALASNSFGSDKVVTGDHAHNDTSFVAESDCIWNFLSNDVLDTNDGNESISSLLNVIEVLSFTNGVVLGTSLVFLKVLVAEGDGSQRLAGIESDGVQELLLDAIVKRHLLALVVQVAVAGIENDLGSSFHVAASIESVLSLPAVLDHSGHSLALGGELESSVGLGNMLLALSLDVDTKLDKHLHHSLFSSRTMLNSARCVAAHSLLQELSVDRIGQVVSEDKGVVISLDGLVNADIDIGDSHFVLGEGSCLVRADVVRASHDLARGELLHEVLVDEHLLH